MSSLQNPVFTHRFHYGNNGMDGSKMSHAKVFDPARYRSRFPEQWSDFLRTNFRNAEEVAVVFGVTFQTANNWWHGTHRPSGDKVALAAVSMPRRFRRAMDWAA